MKGFPFKNAGLVVGYAKPNYGLTVLATPALAGPTTESARDARLIRAKRPDVCAYLMSLAEPERSLAALVVVREHFSYLVFPPSEGHQRNVASALVAQCWQEQTGRRYEAPKGDPWASGEGGNALVNEMARQWNALVNPPHIPGNAWMAGRPAGSSGGILDRFEAGLKR